MKKFQYFLNEKNIPSMTECNISHFMFTNQILVIVPDFTWFFTFSILNIYHFNVKLWDHSSLIHVPGSGQWSYI